MHLSANWALHGCAFFGDALRHRDQGHFKDTTWTSADDDGDENGERFEILSPRNP